MSNVTIAPAATSADVRTWGTENGFTVTAKGRLSHELVAAFNAAHPETQYVPMVAPSTSNVKVERVMPKVDASDVRLWAILNGYADRVNMTRGRLPLDVIAEFNKGRKGSERYVPSTDGERVKIRTTREHNGRKMPYTRTALVSEVRSWAVANGYADMTRGRMTLDTYGAFALANIGE